MALSTGTWLRMRIHTTTRTRRGTRYLFFLLPAAAALFAQLLLLRRTQEQQQQQQQQQLEFGGSYDPPVLISTIPALDLIQFPATAQGELEGNKRSSGVAGRTKTLSNNQTINQDDDDDDYSSPLSGDFIQKLAENLSRVWPHKPISSWCLQQPSFNNKSNVSSTMMLKESNPPPEGLLLVKVPKSASSTVTGVILRIQDRHQCALTEWKHLLAYNYANRSFDNSFLVAPIREPATRALSNLFFHDVSFHGRKRGRPRRQQQQQPAVALNSTISAAATSSVSIGRPSDRHIRNGLLRAEPNYILQYTSLVQPPPPLQTAEASKPKKKKHPPAHQEPHWNFRNASLEMLQEHVVSVIAGYDFLIVVERLPESLVVMALLTGLDITDLLTMSSKQAGMWYYTGGGRQKGKCIALIKPIQSLSTKALFESHEWKKDHVGDSLLHATAVHSLDRTIEALGVDKVKQAVADLKRWQDRVELACSNAGVGAAASKNETQYPCSATGEPQLELSATSCYIRDFGCGYPCIDRIVDAAA
jgi:hypothetical protein